MFSIVVDGRGKPRRWAAERRKQAARAKRVGIALLGRGRETASTGRHPLSSFFSLLFSLFPLLLEDLRGGTEPGGHHCDRDDHYQYGDDQGTHHLHRMGTSKRIGIGHA